MEYGEKWQRLEEEVSRTSFGITIKKEKRKNLLE
jgi:hypothetical protein